MSELQAIPVHFEETDLYELLQTSLRPLVEQAARVNVHVHLAKLGDVPRVRIDREKIAWATTALVGNAMRYLDAHHGIHADVEGHASSRGSIVVHATYEAERRTVSVSVQDDGPGIPDDKVPFLFERRRGSAIADGLALSLVRQIVSAHGGRIEVESRREPDDHGTSITLVLPHRAFGG